MRSLGNKNAKHQKFQRKLGATSDADAQKKIEQFFGIGGDSERT